MKIFKNLVYSFLLLVFFTGCAKTEKIKSSSTTVGNSRITNFPILSLLGNQYLSVAQGSVYIDPGVDAKVGGVDVAVTTDGAVDATTVGVYTLNYTAKNTDGFSATVTRFVAVYSTDATAAANDFSGNYKRTSNGVINTWIRTAPGVYKVINPGGAPGASLTVFLFNSTGTIIDIPAQVGIDGNSTSSTNESYTVGTPSSYTMKIVNPGYGPAQRTFIKQ